MTLSLPLEISHFAGQVVLFTCPPQYSHPVPMFVLKMEANAATAKMNV